MIVLLPDEKCLILKWGKTMITVYVRHYLNENGRTYFDKEWFPYVQQIIIQQMGYELIQASKDEFDVDCRNIIVKFKNQETLNDWVNHPSHQEVINNLDKYRTKAWHWVTMEGNNPQPPKSLSDWNEVALTNVSAAHSL